MTSLWDKLPPEIQEHVFGFLTYVGKTRLSPCHQYIQEYYYDPTEATVTWPLPSPFLNTVRSVERGVPIFIHIDQYGCTRYFRPIFRSGILVVGGEQRVDITQAEIPSYYVI